MLNKRIFLIGTIILAVILLISMPKLFNKINETRVEAKMDKLRAEADRLTAEGEYLEATEVIKEMIALQKGEKYTRDTDPEETFRIKGETETGTLMNYLDFSDIHIIWSKNSDTGNLVGRITNNHNSAVEGYFAIYFYDDNGHITYTRDSIPIPGDGIKPGDSINFSVPVNKFEYSSYEIEGDILREK